MALATFDITFEGTHALQTTSQNAALSGAIIALDRLLTSATRAIYGHLVDPEVDVRRTDVPGLYEVDLGFRLNFGMARRATLSGVARYSDPQPAVVMRALGWTLRDLATPREESREEGTVDGMVPLLLALAGRRIDRLFLVGSQVDIEAGDSLFHMENDAYRLLRHREVRESLAQFAEALRDPAITKIVLTDRKTGELLGKIEPAQVGDFALPGAEPVLLVDEVRTMALQLTAPTFRQEGFWTFTNGARTICAEMADADFLRVIDNGIFAAKPGEILIVNMHVETVQRVDGTLRTRYTVVRVVDHRKPAHHLPMPGI